MLCCFTYLIVPKTYWLYGEKLFSVRLNYNYIWLLRACVALKHVLTFQFCQVWGTGSYPLFQSWSIVIFRWITEVYIYGNVTNKVSVQKLCIIFDGGRTSVLHLQRRIFKSALICDWRTCSKNWSKTLGISQLIDSTHSYWNSWHLKRIKVGLSGFWSHEWGRGESESRFCLTSSPISKSQNVISGSCQIGARPHSGSRGCVWTGWT